MVIKPNMAMRAAQPFLPFTTTTTHCTVSKAIKLTIYFIGILSLKCKGKYHFLLKITNVVFTGKVLQTEETHTGRAHTNQGPAQGRTYAQRQPQQEWQQQAQTRGLNERK